MSNKIFVIGGAGFIGSHFVDALLADPKTEKVTIYDNFSYGREWHYDHHLNDNRLQVVRGDIEDFPLLENSMNGHDTVIHLAANPDIAKSSIDPIIDFKLGIALTNNVLEAMRKTRTNRLLFASSCCVYGDIGDTNATENYGPLLPISTYGASKLAGEALIYSYCFMFGISACAFRFANVVGDRQTHGIAFDFINKLLKNPKELSILGDGTQSKPYIHVTELVNAALLANQKLTTPYEVYNLGTETHMTVKEIAETTVECLNFKNVEFKYAGGNRGWKGDVPIVRINVDKIYSLGWICSMSSHDAIRNAINSMIPNIREGKMK
jgi:UDP-glucose 4-epimerase